ncbi:HD domain-containing phosphohydrolase [Singulisphaera sp. Ch08]|uniref:HD domain-containing phosphohydrolase n=1 Tax=Singulisphaera sp. Ch08 TaxID=3120278 RepID=A0AAU7CNW3_9BACT
MPETAFESQPRTAHSSENPFQSQRRRVARRTDRLFAALLIIQWLVVVATALLGSPRASAGQAAAQTSLHIWALIVLGGVIASLPIALSLVRDIAERREADEWQARLVTILEATTDFVGVADRNGRVLYVNGAGQRMVGIRQEEVLQTNIPDYLTNEAKNTVENEGLAIANREGVWSGEAVFQRRDGSEIPISLVILAHKNPHGVVESFSTIARDITERKRAEKALLLVRDELEVRVAERTAELSRANQELVREVAERKRAEKAQARMVAILDATTDFVGIADMKGRPLYVNEAGLRMVGLKAEDLPHATIADFHPDWVMELIRNESMPASIRDGVWSGEVALLRRDGSEFPVSMVSLAHKDPHGDVEFTSIIARDVTERNRTEQEIRLLNSQLKNRLYRLKSHREIDKAITARLDLGITFDILLDQVTSQLGVDAADVLLIDSDARELRYAKSKGFQTDSMFKVPLELDRSIPGLVALEARALHFANLSQGSPQFVRAEAMLEEGFVAYSAVPLIFQGKVKGVLEVFHRAPLELNEEWLDFFGAFAGQAAIAIENATLFEDLQRTNAELTVAYDATIEGWSRALDLRDKETEGHTRRVTEMSVRLARAMGMGGADLINVRRGALLHDVGKLGIPDEVLLKPGALTDEEWALMRRHPTYAYEWLAPIAFLRPALEIPYCHHEKLDGTGYPRGLKGDEIPLAARIFTVVDIWDALRSDRPYRAGWPEERVLAYINALSGSHLDPRVVQAFFECRATDRMDAAEDFPRMAATESVVGNLPARPTVHKPGHFPAEPKVENPFAAPSGLTILVAENNQPHGHILNRTLKSMGHEVLLAADGEEAWRAIVQGRPRVVIADWVLPRLNGLALCRRIRNRTGLPYTYVILVNGPSDGQNRTKALNAGADDFLTKPLDLQQLTASLAVARRFLNVRGDLAKRKIYPDLFTFVSLPSL